MPVTRYPSPIAHRSSPIFHRPSPVAKSIMTRSWLAHQLQYQKSRNPNPSPPPSSVPTQAPPRRARTKTQAPRRRARAKTQGPTFIVTKTCKPGLFDACKTLAMKRQRMKAINLLNLKRMKAFNRRNLEGVVAKSPFPPEIIDLTGDAELTESCSDGDDSDPEPTRNSSDTEQSFNAACHSSLITHQ